MAMVILIAILGAYLDIYEWLHRSIFRKISRYGNNNNKKNMTYFLEIIVNKKDVRILVLIADGFDRYWSTDVWKSGEYYPVVPAKIPDFCHQAVPQVSIRHNDGTEAQHHCS